MNFIDAHSHIWTPDTERYPLAAGFRRADMNPPSFTSEELRQQAISVGVNRVVLIQMTYYGDDNSYILDTIAQYPEMYRGVGVIDQESPDVANTMRTLKEQGVSGFRIEPKQRPVESWLSSEGMRRMWACGADQNLALCCLINPNALPALDRMCDDFPETPVVIDHMCRIGATGEINVDELQALCDMAKHKRLTVKVSAFYALGQKRPPYHDLVPTIRQIYESFGPERLMWASDAPFQVAGQHTYQASIDVVQSGLDFLKPVDLEWMLCKTAERVFFC